MSTVVGNLSADTTLLRLFTAHTLPYINTILGLKAFFWFFKPSGCDQEVVLKDRYKITATRSTITQNSAVLFLLSGQGV
jgi:hypothetical protein